MLMLLSDSAKTLGLCRINMEKTDNLGCNMINIKYFCVYQCIIFRRMFGHQTVNLSPSLISDED